jgi:FkbM family methyltransferase
MLGWLRDRRKFSRAKRFYSQWMGPTDLCFDIGANIGDRTAVFRALGARVVAVDPQPSAVKSLQSRWGNDPQVTLAPVALGQAPGRAKLRICNEASTISTMSRDWATRGRFSKDYSWDTEIEVDVTTLDELIRIHGVPRFIKIDVEGFEREVLAGLSTPVGGISIEYAREMSSVAFESIREIQRIFDNKAEFSFSYAETLVWSTGWMTAEELTKWLNSRPDPADWGDIYSRPIR